MGLAVNIGAHASFFDLFNASTGAKLFNKNFPLLQKCVGLSNSTSEPVKGRDNALRDGDDTSKSSSPSSTSQGLGCPLPSATQLNQLANAVIPGT